jgi:hypothetical protein
LSRNGTIVAVERCVDKTKDRHLIINLISETKFCFRNQNGDKRVYSCFRRLFKFRYKISAINFLLENYVITWYIELTIQSC